MPAGGRSVLESQRRPGEESSAAGRPVAGAGLRTGVVGAAVSDTTAEALGDPLADGAVADGDLLCVDELPVHHRHDADDRRRGHLSAIHGDRLGVSVWNAVPERKS